MDTFMNNIKVALFVVLLFMVGACKKDQDSDPEDSFENVESRIETFNGITYKVYFRTDRTGYQGILVMGSGNDAVNPGPGSLDGTTENNTCRKAAANGYVAAVVQYRKTAGVADWNGSANSVGEDFANCIDGLASKYAVDKNKSVVGGVSYASAMLLTELSSAESSLAHTKGLLASCWTADAWKASNFIVPVFNIVCNCDCDGGELKGQALIEAINPAVRGRSEAVVDNSCSTHCGGNWVDKLYAKMDWWLKN